MNPALSEARLARTAAATILNRLVGVKARALTNSQRGRAAANAHWSRFANAAPDLLLAGAPLGARPEAL